MPECTCGGQKTTCTRWLSPSIMWVPGIEFRSSALVAGNLLALCYFLAVCFWAATRLSLEMAWSLLSGHCELMVDVTEYRQILELLS